MIIESLCHFPKTKRKRAKKAERAMRRTLENFRPELRKATFAAFVMQVVPLAIPVAIHHWLPRLLDGSAEERGITLTWLVVVFLLVAAIRAMAHYLFLCLAATVGHQLVAAMREMAHSQLMRLPVRYVETRETGAILLRFIGDSDALRNWFGKTGPKLVADAVVVTLIFAGLIYLSWPLTLVLILPMTAFATVVTFLSKPIREKTRVSRRRQASLTGMIGKRISTIRDTKIAEAHGMGRDPVEAAIAEVSALNMSRDRSAAALEAWAQMALFSGASVVLLFGFQMVWRGSVSPPSFISFLWLSLHLVVTIRSSLGAIVIHQKAIVSVERLYVMLARPSEPGRGRSRIQPEFKTLTFVHLGRHYQFQPGIHPLPSGIDLDALASGLLGFDSQKLLAINLDGIPIDKTDVKTRRRCVLILKGDPPSHSATVIENPATENPTATPGIRIVLSHVSSRTETERLVETMGVAVDHRAIVLYACDQNIRPSVSVSHHAADIISNQSNQDVVSCGP